jgi:hypothetical protein
MLAREFSDSQLKLMCTHARARAEEFRLQREDIEAWCGNMQQGLRDVADKLMVHEMVLQGELLSATIVTGLAKFPLGHIDDEVHFLRRQSAGPDAALTGLPSTAWRIRRTAVAAVEFVAALRLFHDTGRAEWAAEYMASIASTTAGTIRPQTAELRRCRSTPTVCACEAMSLVCAALEANAHWLEPLMTRVYSFRSTVVDLVDSTVHGTAKLHAMQQKASAVEVNEKAVLAEVAFLVCELQRRRTLPGPRADDGPLSPIRVLDRLPWRHARRRVPTAAREHLRGEGI